MNPEIEFSHIISTATGEEATSGRLMQDAFNNNFDRLKTLLKDLYTIVSVQVSSDEITKIKVDTSTDPYLIYYTLDPVDTEDPTWILLSSSFATLDGQPSDNIALKAALDSKASALAVENLTIAVANNTTDVADLKLTTSGLSTDVGALQVSVTDMQGSLANNVETPSGKLYLRYDSYTNSVEYSLDKTTWSNILASDINFVDIGGNPSDNNALVSYVNNAIATTITGLATTQDLAVHTSNMNNPHNVTAAQLGLGTVIQDIAQLKNSKYLHSECDLLTYKNNTLDEGTIYNISSHFSI